MTEESITPKHEEPEVKHCIMCGKVANTSICYDGEYHPACKLCRDLRAKDAMMQEIGPSVQKLFDHVNGHSGRASSEAFIQAFQMQHRTSQQSFFSTFIVPLILHEAGLKTGWYDLRNEATVNLCKRLASACKDSPLPLY
jgi:hypothetical protein